MTANERILDLSLRHAVGVQRMAGGDVRAMLAMLQKAEKDLEKKLLTRLKTGDWTSKRYKTMLQEIRVMRRELFASLHATSREKLLALAKAEQEFTRGILNRALPIELNYASASAQTLNTLVTATPFSGGANAARTLSQWWESVAAADQRRIIEAIQMGMVQGETVPEMTGRVLASQSLTRANAETVVRTAVNHVSNGSRDAFFAENKDIMEAVMWVSTLDGRTTLICMERDGCYDAVGDTPMSRIPEPHLDPPGARPPAHPRCRSITVGVLDALGVEAKMPERPFVRDTRTGRQREMDFRADTKAKVGPKRWKEMSRKQRNSAVKRTRQDWVKQNVGTVPGKTTYEEWLRRQPTSFQNEVLGIRKAQAFRKGLTLDKFVERTGHELTLKELAAKFPDYMAG